MIETRSDRDKICSHEQHLTILVPKDLEYLPEFVHTTRR